MPYTMSLPANASEKDVLGALAALEGACMVLAHNVREAGLAVPQAPPAFRDEAGGKDILADFNALENYHAQLCVLLSRKAAGSSTASATAKGAETRTTTAAAAPVVAASPSTPIALTGQEVKGLTWVERVRVAQGKLSATDARELLSARKAKADGKKASLTERCLTAKGKTLADLSQPMTMGGGECPDVESF